MARKKTVKSETARITGMMQEAGTFKPYFVDSIDHLAKLYVELEEAEEAYDASDRNISVTQHNKSGKEYFAINPLLQAQFKILEQCRHYEAKLGLTPADHQRMTGGGKQIQGKQESSLTAALRVLSG